MASLRTHLRSVGTTHTTKWSTKRQKGNATYTTHDLYITFIIHTIKKRDNVGSSGNSGHSGHVYSSENSRGSLLNYRPIVGWLFMRTTPNRNPKLPRLPIHVWNAKSFGGVIYGSLRKRFAAVRVAIAIWSNQNKLMNGKMVWHARTV